MVRLKETRKEPDAETRGAHNKKCCFCLKNHTRSSWWPTFPMRRTVALAGIAAAQKGQPPLRQCEEGEDKGQSCANMKHSLWFDLWNWPATWVGIEEEHEEVNGTAVFANTQIGPRVKEQCRPTPLFSGVPERERVCDVCVCVHSCFQGHYPSFSNLPYKLFCTEAGGDRVAAWLSPTKLHAVD